MTLSDSRQCRRLKATLRPLPSHRTGLPRLPEPPFRRAVPTTPADRAGARVDCFPAHAAFPKWQEGRHPHCHFRGLLRLHSRYSPSDCSAALQRPLSRGSSPSGCPGEPLVSYQINRQLSGWNLPPLVIRAFGAHCQFQTFLPKSTATGVTSYLLQTQTGPGGTHESHNAGDLLQMRDITVLDRLGSHPIDDALGLGAKDSSVRKARHGTIRHLEPSRRTADPLGSSST